MKTINLQFFLFIIAYIALLISSIIYIFNGDTIFLNRVVNITLIWAAVLAFLIGVELNK